MVGASVYFGAQRYSEAFKAPNPWGEKCEGIGRHAA